MSWYLQHFHLQWNTTQLVIKIPLGNINQPPQTHPFFFKVTATDHTGAWLWKMSPSFEWSALQPLACLFRAIWLLNAVVAMGCCWKNLAHSVLLQEFLRLFLSSYEISLILLWFLLQSKDDRDGYEKLSSYNVLCLSLPPLQAFHQTLIILF